MKPICINNNTVLQTQCAQVCILCYQKLFSVCRNCKESFFLFGNIAIHNLFIYNGVAIKKKEDTEMLDKVIAFIKQVIDNILALFYGVMPL